METYWDNTVDPKKDLLEAINNLSRLTNLNDTQVRLTNWFLDLKVKYFDRDVRFRRIRIPGNYEKYECVVNNIVISAFTISTKGG